jgi:hypothetical protein
MKTTLDLPDEVIRAVKLRAVMQQRPLKDLVADFLRQGLGMQPSAQVGQPPAGSIVERATNGLPTVRCRAGAAAGGFNLDELLRLEQSANSEEDLKHAGRSL